MPICPACRAKFAHDAERQVCKVCGIPDEVITNGPRAIKRWQRHPTRLRLTESGVYVMEAVEPVQRRGGSVQRRKRRHGRPR
jgi:hypothetical protein